MAGWIKLHRQLTEWEWYDDHNTARLFIHLLLKAQHADSNYRGIIVPTGSVKTGRIQLSAETGLSQQQVRSSLKKLKSTNDITINTTNKYSIIAVNNWGEYQQDNQQTTKPVTNNQPTDNQQVTTCKNDKNDKNENKPSSKEKLLLLPAEAVEVCELIIEHVRQNNPNQKNIKTAAIDKTRLSWASAIEKLNRIDGRGWGEISDVAKWALNDSFWCSNILSGTKLREKFDDLYIKKSNKPSGQSSVPSHLHVSSSRNPEDFQL